MRLSVKIPHPLFFIAPLGFLLYAQCLFYDYTNFDDNTLIKENQHFIGDIGNLFSAFGKSVFLTGSDVFYRPLETVWFMLNAQLGESNLLVYHLSAIGLHIFASYLFFLFLIRLNNSREASLLLSLIFLVHPSLVQAVAWVPGVVDVLVMIFSVLSFLFFLDFTIRQQRKFFLLHLLFFAFAMFSKETGIIVTAVCLFNLHFVMKEKMFSYNKKVLLTGWFFVLVVWFLMRESALREQPQKEFAELLSSLLVNFPAILPYIGKIFFPLNLSVMPVLEDISFGYGMVAFILLLLLIFFFIGKKQTLFYFGLLWFVLFLLPTFLSTSAHRVHQFYEHRLYLPLVGFLLAMAQTIMLKKISFQKRFHLFSAVAVLVFFFILAFFHIRTFSNTETFLNNAVKTSPHSSLAHRNLGIYFQDLADRPENKERKKELLQAASEEYQKALALNPHEKDLRNNLGVIYDQFGKKELAEKEYTAETKINPGNSQAWHNLGVLYAERNENEKAEFHFNRSLEIKKTESTLSQLAKLYRKTRNKKKMAEIVSELQLLQSGKISSATNASSVYPSTASLTIPETGQLLLKTIAEDSSDKIAFFNLGLLYYKTGRKADAEKMWCRAIRLDSLYVEAYNNLAICLALQGKNEEAEKILLRVVQMNPAYMEGYFNLANFYARNGKADKALAYIGKLKAKGIDEKYFIQRSITLSPELQKLFRH